jgi:hypothetical protein
MWFLALPSAVISLPVISVLTRAMAALALLFNGVALMPEPCPECGGSGKTGEGRWYRPGPSMESRALGKWPSQATYGIWSDRLWDVCGVERPFIPTAANLPEIGADIGRFGDDFSAFHVRWGRTSLWHERHNGWDTTRVSDRLAEMAREYRNMADRMVFGGGGTLQVNRIKIKVDDSTFGGGVVDQLRRDGYNVQGVNAAGRASDASLYPNRRSELWFVTALLAKKGGVDMSRISKEMQKKLRQQFLAPTWKQNGAGQRVVEPKEMTKDRLPGCGSPDDADSANLCYYTLYVPGLTGVDSLPNPEQVRARR